MKPVLYLAYGCLVIGGALLIYIDQLNELTRLRLEIPQHIKELRRLQEENEAMQYEIDQFESPIYLMELLKKPEFSHLKFPRQSEIVVIESARPQNVSSEAARPRNVSSDAARPQNVLSEEAKP